MEKKNLKIKKEVKERPEARRVDSARFKKRLKGEVVSNKMEKTVVVKVERLVTHPIYKKKYKVYKKYKAHDEKNEFKVGDLVEIEETRPISKEKRWKVVRKNDSAKDKIKSRR